MRAAAGGKRWRVRHVHGSVSVRCVALCVVWHVAWWRGAKKCLLSEAIAMAKPSLAA